MATRLRVRFEKTEQMRYTGHLDLYRTWERTIRRAGLPLAYSEGFKPHPRISLASALPLGFTSQEELIDIYLEQELPLSDVLYALKHAAPPGVEVYEVVKIEGPQPATQVEMQAAEYFVTFIEVIPELEQHVQTLLLSPSLPRQRRGKNYDLRPLLLEAEVLTPDEKGLQRMRLVLRAQEGATGRPEEVVLALGAHPETARFHRTRLIFRNS